MHMPMYITLILNHNLSLNLIKIFVLVYSLEFEPLVFIVIIIMCVLQSSRVEFLVQIVIVIICVYFKTWKLNL
jgi:hypothetical protein